MAKQTGEKNRQTQLFVLLSIIAIIAVYWFYTKPNQEKVGMAKEDRVSAENAVTAMQSQLAEYSSGAALQSSSAKLSAADKYMPHLPRTDGDTVAQVKLDTLPKLKRALEQNGMTQVSFSAVALNGTYVETHKNLINVTVKAAVQGTPVQLARAVETLINQGVPATVIEVNLSAPTANQGGEQKGAVISTDTVFTCDVTFGVWFTASAPVKLTPADASATTTAPKR